MWVPNLLHPGKLANNLKNPIGEVFHTKHSQYPLDSDSKVFAVEHELFGRKVTLDIVKPAKFPRAWLLKTMQLFDPKFYYGHANYFPQAFELVDRTFLPKGTIFDINDYLASVATKREALLRDLISGNERFKRAEVPIQNVGRQLTFSRRIAQRILQVI